MYMCPVSVRSVRNRAVISNMAALPIICKRIRNEEMVLEKELKGYKEYKCKVKYRLIPFVW